MELTGTQLLGLVLFVVVIVPSTYAALSLRRDARRAARARSMAAHPAGRMRGNQ